MQRAQRLRRRKQKSAMDTPTSANKELGEGESTPEERICVRHSNEKTHII